MGSQWKVGLSLDCLFPIPADGGGHLSSLMLCSAQRMGGFTHFDQGSMSFLLLFWVSLPAAIPSP